MLNKTIYALGLTLVLLTATSPILLANSSSSYHHQTELQESIPNEVVIAVCTALEKNRVADAITILGWYRSGEMTITKVESGVYRVVLPSGAITSVLIDAL